MAIDLVEQERTTGPKYASDLGQNLAQVGDGHQHIDTGHGIASACFGIGGVPCKDGQVYQITPRVAGFSDTP